MNVSQIRQARLIGRQIMIAIVFAICISIGHAQETPEYSLSYGIHKVVTPFAQTRDSLLNAQTVTDLNQYFERSWVNRYHALEVMASCNDAMEKVVSQNDTLTPGHLDLLRRADIGKDIHVLVHYIPENDLQHNDLKTFDFFISIDPDVDAQFPGGSSALRQYLDESDIARIPKESIREHQLAAIKFTIDESGEIMDPHITSSSENESIDQVMIDVLCAMPTWTPARYTDGPTVPQEFVLTLGDMKSCVVNLLNIRIP